MINQLLKNDNLIIKGDPHYHLIIKTLTYKTTVVETKSTVNIIFYRYILKIIESVYFSSLLKKPEYVKNYYILMIFQKNMIPYCYLLLSPGRRKHVTTWITIGFNNY